MQEEHYFEVEADDHYELGLELGARFAKNICCQVKDLYKDCDIRERRYRKRYKQSLDLTGEELSKVMEELRGYADGAGVEHEEMWWIAIGDDIDSICGDHCTTVIANGGRLIGHNEDWSADSAEDLYIVKETVPGLTILELYYAGGLGGNAISINSHGFVHSVNWLPLSRNGEGTSRNFIARWLSETQNPELDYDKMERMPRMSGYSHNFASLHLPCYNIESCAKNAAESNPDLPFCHTNHFLQKIDDCPFEDEETESVCRYKRAKELADELANEEMSVEDMKRLLSDAVGRGDRAIFNQNTIGRVIVDLDESKAHFWLLRNESEDDWETYDIDFIH